jgi:hypothetical protein
MKQMKQDNHLFEYAVIRVVPHVEREEFVNVGVILLCARLNFLKTRILLSEQKIRALCERMDLGELKEHVSSLERICKGGPDSGPIGKLSLAERFRWLTATRSTVLQTSKVHPGLCPDPDEMLERLFNQLVV